MNLALMHGKCAESLDTTAHSRKPVCLNTPLLQGRPHGWLCAQHAADEDTQWRLSRSKQRAIARDLDKEQVEGIIAGEMKAIRTGKITSTRYGSLEPTYFKTWSV